MPMAPLLISVLRLPDLRLRTSYTVLPLPNAIDTWLSASSITICEDCFGSTVHLGDLPSDQVICTVQLHEAEESSL
jgi:hypothetical protein